METETPQTAMTTMEPEKVLDPVEETRFLLEQLAHWRLGLAEDKAALEAAREVLEATPEYAAYAEHEQLLRMTQKETENLERQAREMIALAYRVSGEKRPAEGAGVRVQVRYRYEREPMLAWARERRPELIIEQLDDKVLLDRKNAPGLQLMGAPLEEYEQVQATIATDLSSYIVDRGGNGDAHGQ